MSLVRLMSTRIILNLRTTTPVRFAINRTSSAHRAQHLRYYFPIINRKIVPRGGERTRAFRTDMPLEIRICARACLYSAPHEK